MRPLKKTSFHFTGLLLCIVLNQIAFSNGIVAQKSTLNLGYGNNMQRMKRSAYIFRMKPSPSDLMQEESNELVPVRNMPAAMVFRGAGYLRSNEDSTRADLMQNTNYQRQRIPGSAIRHHIDTAAFMEGAQSAHDYASVFPLMHMSSATRAINKPESAKPVSRLQNHRIVPNGQGHNYNPGTLNHQLGRSEIPHTRSKRSYRSDDPYERDHYRASEDERRYGGSPDHEDSGSGFIPLSGHFNGGAIHLTLPFYGSGPSVLSSGTPIGSSYGGPESRPYVAREENYFYPAEHRRYSYGILGSGNFEVIKGGTYPNQGHGGRSPYHGGEDYNNYNYGTREMIFDGPIQGFQGFDNFPIHLINALSKQSEYAVRKPGHR